MFLLNCQDSNFFAISKNLFSNSKGLKPLGIGKEVYKNF
jgi:hypothetical protein